MGIDEERELKRLDDELQTQRKRTHDLVNLVQPLAAVPDKLKELHDTVKTGYARLESKLDDAGRDFNIHAGSDIEKFTELRMTAQQVQKKLDESDIRRREDSERRMKAIELSERQKLSAIEQVERNRVNAEKARDQREEKRDKDAQTARRWRWGIIITFVSALAAAWFTNYLESKSSKTILEQIKVELQKK